MRQVIQNNRSGKLRVVEAPGPLARPGHVLIANAASVLSAGTERAAREAAKKTLWGKARARPDEVRRVWEKVRTEGLWETARQVRERLEQPMPLGYASSGVVLACGEGVQEYKPGERVASNGPHAGVVCVPKHLCARVPDGVPLEHAAFTVLGAIALHGVRLAQAALGETAFVIGLGLIGQLAVALLKAAGCRVIGTDPDAARCALALKMGAEAAWPGGKAQDVLARSGGRGADAVLIAASASSNQPLDLAVQAVRPKGRIVLLGVVGLQLERRSFYYKEAQFTVSRSYGPGRYDPLYEEGGQDYPAAYVRWTEQRNLQAVLELMAAGKLDVGPLISHRFPIEKAEAAYALIERKPESCLGVLLEYPPPCPPGPARRIQLRPVKEDGRIGIGVLGAGQFARTVLLPALNKTPGLRPVVLCSAGGTNALCGGEKWGFQAAASDEDEVFSDPRVRAVFVLTRHDLHARQVVKALRAGKHVFVEKPLALTLDELLKIEEALAHGVERAPLLQVGFNRRFAPAARMARAFFEHVRAPLSISIRFNAGAVKAEHWTQNKALGGGRIIGEACHAVDLATYLTGERPVRVFAESVGGLSAPAITDDQCFITLRHAGGSISNIAYLAGGDRALPKERVEIFGGGRAAIIEDSGTLITCAEGRIKRRRLWRKDKGHRGELEAFARALREGGPAPIPWEELRAVSLASILAVQSLRTGMPVECRAPIAPS